MSVIWSIPRVNENIHAASSDCRVHTGMVLEAQEQGCFLCGKELSLPCVHWHGATAKIYLHPECVKDLMVALCRDVDETKNPGRYLPREHWEALFMPGGPR